MPCPTRWNSLFDALALVVSLMASQPAAFDSLFHDLDISGPLSSAEKLAVQDYVAVMRPLCESLDLLQADNGAYLGCLLPYLAGAMLLTEKRAAKHPGGGLLANVIVNDIRKRFNKDFKDDNTRLAAGFHPRFKTHWLKRPEEREALRLLMVDALSNWYAKQGPPPPAVEPDHSSDDDDDEDETLTLGTMYANEKWRRNQPQNAAAEVDQFIQAGVAGNSWREDLQLPGIRSLFLQYNTPIPSSAAVERLFSVGKDVLRPKRTSMTDANFNKVMFLQTNEFVL